MANSVAVTKDAEQKNRTEQVYEQILEILINGELRPGDVIVERKIANHLNASRTPVREALSRLEAERLVHRQQNRGVIVSPFSYEALLEILNVRQVLESEASRLAAGRMPKARVDEVRTEMKAISEKENLELAEIWRVDDMLHRAIADASGNSLLAGMIEDLRRRTHVFNAFRSLDESRFNYPENSKLLDAVAEGDAAEARQAMYDHIENVKNTIINRLTGIIR